jgi:hypothetical protein
LYQYSYFWSHWNIFQEDIFLSKTFVSNVLKIVKLNLIIRPVLVKCYNAWTGTVLKKDVLILYWS